MVVIDADTWAALAETARHFNAGRYFEAHEALEEHLEAIEDDALFALCVGLIRIAVGYHKVSQQLWQGAAGMFAKALDALDEVPAVPEELQLAEIVERTRADMEALRAGTFAVVDFETAPPRFIVAPPR